MIKREVRLRFAPSPTGYLHVGGLRTALFNYLFAKQNNGKIILRIEDTDQKRLVKDSIDKIIASLKWIGIDFDEGPHTKNQNKGPYAQSERLDLYRENVVSLIEKGYAYTCLYPDERILQISQDESLKKSAAEYDKKFKDNRPEDSISNMKKKNSVVRLAMPANENILVKDLIRGNLKFDSSLLDDPIIIKSDGYPTYHFANVVDDHHMKISHVIRGEEWLPSLPKHIHLYKCFNWEIPEFAHLPLLLNHDRTKLSKRQGDVAVEDYIKKGYFRESLVNFIALLGWHESNNREFYTMNDLIDAFSLKRVQSSGAIFDIKKLNWINQHYLRQKSSNEIIQLSKNHIPSDWSVNEKMVDLIKDKTQTIEELKEDLKIFFRTPENLKKKLEQNFPSSTISNIQASMIKNLEKYSHIDKEIFNQIMKKVAEESDCKGKNLWQPVRLMLTGQARGPELLGFMQAIGIQECINRLKDVK